MAGQGLPSFDHQLVKARSVWGQGPVRPFCHYSRDATRVPSSADACIMRFSDPIDHYKRKTMTNDRAVRSSLTTLVIIASFACSPTPKYVINQPANSGSIVCTDPAGVSCSVDLNVQWDGVSVRPQPETELDGTALTITYGTSGKSSVATLTMPTGSHTLKVSGDLMAKGTVSNYSATSAFTVTPKPPAAGGFTLSVNPTAIIVERGKTAQVSVTLTPAPAAATSLSLAPAIPGVSITPASITGGTAAITISATAAAVNGTNTVALNGTSGSATGGTQLKITVGRVSGNFAEANPTPYQSTVPSSKTALAGGFRADISVGAPSVPQPRKANFFRGTSAVGNDIGFTLGPVSNVGGAGFCANSAATAITRGVVLSGQLPGHSSQNTVTFLDVTVTSPTLIEQPADMNVQHNATGPFILFQPRVFFSPDCTIALVAGANALGPSKHILRVYDLISGQPIGSEVPFETATFSALLRTVGSKQEIEIKVDTGIPATVYQVP